MHNKETDKVLGHHLCFGGILLGTIFKYCGRGDTMDLREGAMWPEEQQAKIPRHRNVICVFEKL